MKYPKMLHVSIQENVYNSSLDPRIWGPPFWYMLHMAATHAQIEGYQSWQRQGWEAIIKGLPYVLPCMECQLHARAFIESHPILIQNRTELFVFLVLMHNGVNLRNGKPTLSVEQAIKEYGFNDSHAMVNAHFSNGPPLSGVLKRIDMTRQTLTVDGVDPKIWFPLFWFTLFNIAINLPVIMNSMQMSAVGNFIKGLPVLFPHQPSQKKLSNWINSHPPIYHASGRLFSFPDLVDMYNAMVAMKIHPSAKPLTYTEAENKYGKHTFNASLLVTFGQNHD